MRRSLFGALRYLIIVVFLVFYRLNGSCSWNFLNNSARFPGGAPMMNMNIQIDTCKHVKVSERQLKNKSENTISR